MNRTLTWKRYEQRTCDCPKAGITVDYSRMDFEDDLFDRLQPAMETAFRRMDELERGGIANPDESRMVGHYWLRDASRAPTRELKETIRRTLVAIEGFARAVHAGEIKPQRAKRFENFLVIGIGGSALGPQLVAAALGTAQDPMRPFFFDNTDPDGMDGVLQAIGAAGGPAKTLAIVVSKSGGTKETRNGMLEAAAAWRAAGLDFAKHAVAVTGDGSELDRHAQKEDWIARFPMWDWVGGRTSELAAVGLLPAALQGIDIQGMLAGARAMDAQTRIPDVRRNPAAILAAMWYHAGKGKGQKAMVILPYKDRLALFSKYLQQLVMESLGKEKDLRGRRVHSGIAVYGNKGSTDQHAYVQQLRDGQNNFFATFVEILEDRSGKSMAVEPGATSGDYLSGFLAGTRQALWENDRESITLTARRIDPPTMGAFIALYERAVGFYGSLVGINAYHQPGVEAGKKAATAVLALQARVLAHLAANKKKSFTAPELAEALGEPESAPAVFGILRHAAANPDHGVTAARSASPLAARFKAG